MTEQIGELSAIRELVASRRYPEAVARLSPYLLQRPQDAEAHCLMAECQLRLGSAGGALAAAGEAVRLDPQLGRAHLIGSLAASRLGQVPVALAAAEQAARLLPSDPDVWVQLSAAAKAAGKNATALDAADRAAKLAPGDPAAARALAQIHGVTSGGRDRLSRSIVVLFVAGIFLAGIGAGEWRTNLKTASSCAQSLAGGTCSGYTGAAVLGVIVLAIGLILLVVAVFRWMRWRSTP